MSKEEALKIQTCVLRVNIHCDGCQKKVKKILHKIEGKYVVLVCMRVPDQDRRGAGEADGVRHGGCSHHHQEAEQGRQAGRTLGLQGWRGEPVSKAPPWRWWQGPGQGRQRRGPEGRRGGGGGGGSKDAKMVLPQLSPQQLQQMQMKGLKLPPQFMDAKTLFAAAAPMKDPKSVKFNLPEDDVGDDGGSEFDDDFDDDDEGLDDDFYDDPKMMMKPMAMPPNTCGGDKKGGNGIGNGGKKGGGGNEIPVQIKGIANNGGGGKKDAGGKQNQGGGKNGGGGQPNNAKGGAPSGGNHPGQGKKGGGGPTVSVSGPMAGMTQQQAMMRRNMMGGASFPGMGPMGGPMGHPHTGSAQGGGGAVPSARFYQGGGGSMPSGPEILQVTAAAGNPTALQQYMALMQQQQMMMMNGHGHAYGLGHHSHGGAGVAGYPPMGYGYGRPRMPYPYPMPPHPHAEPYSYFSDENPNSCSMM